MEKVQNLIINQHARKIHLVIPRNFATAMISCCTVLMPPQHTYSKYILWNLHYIQSNIMYSPTSIIRTSIIRTLNYPNSRSKENAGYCDHVTGLSMHSKPTSLSCHARASYCAAIKSSFNAQRSKRNAR